MYCNRSRSDQAIEDVEKCVAIILHIWMIKRCRLYDFEYSINHNFYQENCIFYVMLSCGLFTVSAITRSCYTELLEATTKLGWESGPIKETKSGERY